MGKGGGSIRAGRFYEETPEGRHELAVRRAQRLTEKLREIEPGWRVELMSDDFTYQAIPPRGYDRAIIVSGIAQDLSAVIDEARNVVGDVQELLKTRRPVATHAFQRLVGDAAYPVTQRKVNCTVVICSDGAVFEYSPDSGGEWYWSPMPPIPGTPAADEDSP